MEIWKDVVGYEGLYKVSNTGRVISLKCNREKEMKLVVNSAGYYSLSLYKNKKPKTFNVHTLVARAFLGHDKFNYEIVVDHINGDRLNNNTYNLRLTSQRENVFNKKDRVAGRYTSDVMGVWYSKSNDRWYSSVYVNGKSHYVGCFRTKESAYEAYKKALNILSTN